MGWTATDPLWATLTPYQKAAAMAMMEANTGKNYSRDATDVAGAIVNRATKAGQDLGQHVSQSIYQPTIEPNQEARLPSILKNPMFKDLSGWVERRSNGQEEDPVGGATHFLAPESTMVALTKQNPQKYRSWPQWTGYDPSTGSYKGVLTRDTSHAFLAPEGAYSAPGHAQGSMNGGFGLSPTGDAGIAGPIDTADAGHNVPQAAFKDLQPAPPPVSTPAPITAVAGGFGGGFMPTASKALGGIAGAFSKGMSGGNDEANQKMMQAMADEADKENASAIQSDQDRSQKAMQYLLSKLKTPNPQAAFG